MTIVHYRNRSGGGRVCGQRSGETISQDATPDEGQTLCKRCLRKLNPERNPDLGGWGYGNASKLPAR